MKKILLSIFLVIALTSMAFAEGVPTSVSEMNKRIHSKNAYNAHSVSALIGMNWYGGAGIGLASGLRYKYTVDRTLGLIADLGYDWGGLYGNGHTLGGHILGLGVKVVLQGETPKKVAGFAPYLALGPSINYNTLSGNNIDFGLDVEGGFRYNFKSGFFLGANLGLSLYVPGNIFGIMRLRAELGGRF